MGLTSYVLISLLEAGEDATSRAVSEAQFCLAANEDPTEPYTLALTAYALALAGSPRAEETLDALLVLGESSPSGLSWRVGGGSAVAVETAAYALLAITTLGGHEDQAVKVGHAGQPKQVDYLTCSD